MALRQFLVASVFVSSASIAAPGNAFAQRRTAAPITYMRAGDAVSAPTLGDKSHRPVHASRSGAGRLIDGPRGKRIKFRYPDLPVEAPSAAAAPMSISFTEPGVIESQLSKTAAPRAIMESPVKPITPAAAQPLRSAYPAAADEVGLASWYGEAYHGAPTANGEAFDMNALTAAHPTLPLPSLVQVVNEENGREVVVRVNDRGPVSDGQIIEVSKAAAEALGFSHASVANVRLHYLGTAPVSLAASNTAPRTPTMISAPPPEPVSPPVFAEPAFRSEPAARPAATHASTHTASYYVQVGSFGDISNARSLESKLKRDYSVDLASARVNNVDYVRVYVGPFASQEDAEDVRWALASARTADGIVVKR